MLLIGVAMLFLTLLLPTSKPLPIWCDDYCVLFLQTYEISRYFKCTQRNNDSDVWGAYLGAFNFWPKYCLFVELSWNDRMLVNAPSCYVKLWGMHLVLFIVIQRCVPNQLEVVSTYGLYSHLPWWILIVNLNKHLIEAYFIAWSSFSSKWMHIQVIMPLFLFYSCIVYIRIRFNSVKSPS